MILGHKSLCDYEKLFSQFYKAIDIKGLKHRENETPKQKYGVGLFPDRMDLLDRMINKNPRKFLFG